MKKTSLYSKIVLGVCLLLILGGGACRLGEENTPSVQRGETVPLTIIRHSQSTPLVYQVELASTPEERLRGLMFRSSMPEDHGMLFIFEQPDYLSFWMKNTYIPLDLLFLHPDGRIGHIHENAQPHDLRGIPSQIEALMVLEINGGEAARQGIRVGDRVSVKKFMKKSSENLAPAKK